MTLTSTTRQAGWRRRHPGKYAAHLAVQRALKSGAMEKQPCEVCGTTEGRIDAHHDDYNNPLEVRWLCRRDHTLFHKRGAK